MVSSDAERIHKKAIIIEGHRDLFEMVLGHTDAAVLGQEHLEHQRVLLGDASPQDGQQATEDE